MCPYMEVLHKFVYNVTLDELTRPYAHVHHAHAVKLLELGRVQFFNSIDCSYEEQVHRGFLLVVVSLEVDYKREIFSGPIEIATSNPQLEGRNVIIAQQIINQRHKLAVDAKITSVFMNLATKRASDPPEWFTSRLS